jgi:glycosyltransferase involved in cell wall biosynthesis
MTDFRLSFIIPCFNAEKYLAECLDSIYQQDIAENEYEVICVNDGSTDYTRAIILDYQQRHSTLQLIDLKEKRNSGEARNTGLDYATGEFIWFVDADDKIKPNVLAKLMHICSENKLDELLFNFDAIDEQGNQLEVKDLFSDTEVMNGINYVQKYFKNRLSELSIIWRQIYRTKYLKQNNIRFPAFTMGEDGPFAWKSLLLGERVCSVKDTFYLYRRHLNSITKKFKRNNNALSIYDTTFNFSKAVYNLSEELKDININISNELHQIALFSLNNCLSELFLTSRLENKKFYQLIVDNYEYIKSLIPLMSRKNKILIKLINHNYFSFLIYILFCKWFTNSFLSKNEN